MGKDTTLKFVGQPIFAQIIKMVSKSVFGQLVSKIFEKVMGIAELLKLEKKDRLAYEESLKKHRDLKNAMQSQYQLGVEEGMEKGMEKGIINAAFNMHKEGFNLDIIAKVTGLSVEELRKVLN